MCSLPKIKIPPGASYTFDCPLHCVIEAAQIVKGGPLNCHIQFRAVDPDDGLGYTIFPDDGSWPIIVIGPEKTLTEAMDIIAHELAHVICGQDEDHGEKFEQVYEAIFNKYNEIQIAKYASEMEQHKDAR